MSEFEKIVVGIRSSNLSKSQTNLLIQEILSSDPKINRDLFDIRTNVKRMWINGKEVSLESRHTRLYEKYKNRPKPKGLRR